MSYTPESERIEEPLANAIEALEVLETYLTNRIRNPGGWADDHRTWCRSARAAVRDVLDRLEEVDGH